MRAVMLNVPEDMLRDREQRGADRWDEMWEGVLHMNPPPNLDHKDIEADLVTWMKLKWERPFGNKVRQQAAISPDKKWDQNYRTPERIELRKLPNKAKFEVRIAGQKDTKETLPYD